MRIMDFMIKCSKELRCSLIKGKMSKRNICNMRKAKQFSALFLGIILACVSCKKEEGDLGLLVQPQEDRLNIVVSDTSTIRAFTVLEDSLRSDEYLIDLIGSYVDPSFGVSTASIYTQIRMESEAVDFTSVSGSVAETVVDSIYLYLDLNGNYGTLDPQTFEVFRITEDLYLDSSYYSNSVIPNDGVDLVEVGAGTIVPDPFNFSTVDGDLINPVLKIKLANSLGDALVAESGSGNLADNTSFTDWFKGLYIRVNNASQSSGEGSILYLDLLNSYSRMSMYYRYTFTGEEDTLKFNFNINTSCARFNSASHDYAGTVIESQLLDTTEGNETIYLQCMSGVKSKIMLPFLGELPDSIVVNKAEVVLPYDYFESDPYFPHVQLYLLGIDDEGASYFLEDFFEGETLYGGVRDNSNKEFRFNIVKHVNNVLTGAKSNNGLFLISTSAMVSANRTIINGVNSTNKNKMKIIFTYTKL